MARAEVRKLMERMAIPAIAAADWFLVSNPALTLACCAEGIMGSFPAQWHAQPRAVPGLAGRDGWKAPSVWRARARSSRRGQ